MLEKGYLRRRRTKVERRKAGVEGLSHIQIYSLFISFLQMLARAKGCGKAGCVLLSQIVFILLIMCHLVYIAHPSNPGMLLHLAKLS